MEKDGLVKKSQEITHRESKVNHNAPNIWSLPDVRFNINPGNRDHELDCVDFFVGLFNSLDDKHRLTHWDYYWDEQEKEIYAERFKFWYDRRFVLDGHEYYLEVDNGTKSVKAIQKQFEAYVRFSQAFPSERFNVLITAQGYRSLAAETRATQIYNIVSQFKRGHQFLVSMHNHACENPLARVWKSPLDPKGFVSLAEL